MLLLTTLFAWRIFGSQIERDRECRQGVEWTVRKVEGLRSQLGRLPTQKEIRRDYYRFWLVRYLPWSQEPTYLQKLGAHGDQDYLLEFWRSERMIYYYSWSQTNTCDSEAWLGALCFYGIAVPLAGGLLWIGLRRKSAG